MRRIIVLIASSAIYASTIPTVASECTSIKDINACVYQKPYPGLLSEESAKLAR